MRSTLRILTVLSLLAFAGIVGCASKPAPITHYLLRGEPVDGVRQIEGGVRVGLGRIVIAPYLLSSKGIMVETAAGEVNPGNQHQWAEPLDAGLHWYLRSEIGRALGRDIGGGVSDRQSWDYTVNIAVSRFHGTMAGAAIIEAEFSVIPADKSQTISQVRFSKSVGLPQEGYVGVVEAEKSLARELAELIADELRKRIDADSSDPSESMGM